MGIQFGSFTAICETAALVICPLVETSQGVEPTCYSRNVEIGGTLIFQPCEFASVDWFSSERGFLLLVHGRRFALTSVLSRTSAASWHTESFFATLESVIRFKFVGECHACHIQDQPRNDIAWRRAPSSSFVAPLPLRSTWPSLLLILSLHPATCFVHIVAIIMTAIMIIHIRSKYTAVGESAALVWSSRWLTPNDIGRKEIVTFFWMYALIELLAMFLDSGIIPTDNVTYTVCCSPFFLLSMSLPFASGSLRCIRAW